ncbi:sensory rhodopsin transducer [Scopulibacillus cellulosilyticus]|uniref:Sensory rhodopsin transducer n=2 Tax=Scopulibacillus cellulosilyticus TaxID=2665665 RepID=A0ABW2Q604_9BACL
MLHYGEKVWLISDAYLPEHSSGRFPSHESVCLLNTGETDAKVHITLYFEDKEPMTGFKINCLASRTLHVRMDQLTSEDGQSVPVGVPYAILVESDQPIVVQYSRMDTSQPEMALMTTMAYKG